MKDQILIKSKNIGWLLFLWNGNVITILIIISSFIIYLFTMCRSVGFTDSGELAAVVCTLGIAHPTGYPLFTLLGRAWILIPLQFEEIIRLNILSALLTSIACGLFFKFLISAHRYRRLFRIEIEEKKSKENNRFKIASIIASLILGFSTTFWLQSTAFEVYALHLVLILISLLLFTKGMEQQLLNTSQLSKQFILSSYVLGLSFTNHMTTVLLLPALFWLFFKSFGLNKNAIKRAMYSIPAFLLGLSVYIYLPVRSASEPILDWGHPVNLERFYWHISGKQFSVWLFSGWDVVKKQFNYYINNFTSEFHFIFLILIVIGSIFLWKRARKYLVFLLILFFSTVIYSVNYDIFDINSYFLLSYIVVGVFIAYGIYYIFQTLDNTLLRNIIILFALIILPCIQVIFNWAKADESGNRVPEKFVREVFSKLEPNSVVITTQWDYFVSPALYYQIVKSERKDVTIIDKHLLQNRTWYFIQMKHTAPWLMNRIEPNARAFLNELNKFEYNLPFDFNMIQRAWLELLRAIVEESWIDHSVYIDARIDQEFPPEYYRTPNTFFLRLSKEPDSRYLSSLCNFIDFQGKINPVIKDLQNYYILILLRESDWLIKQNRLKEAQAILLAILKMEPNQPFAIWLLDKIK